MGLLNNPNRLAAAKTFLMVPVWTDQTERIKGKCEHCGCQVAWDPDSAAVMQEMKTHLLCPLCMGLLFDVLGNQVESLGKLDGGTVTR
jgi:Zn finger protein HypA/HybF involved in hydrogenase expression